MFKTDTWSYFDLADVSKVKYGNETLSTKNLSKRLGRGTEVRHYEKTHRPYHEVTLKCEIMLRLRNCGRSPVSAPYFQSHAVESCACKTN